MAGWRIDRVSVGVAAVVTALAVGMIAPTAAEASSSRSGNQGSSSQSSSAKHKHKRTDSPARATQKARPGAASSAGKPGTAQAPKPKAKSKKDKPPDRGPNKFSPQRRSPAGQSSPGSATGSSRPKAKVGADRPADRGPNKVTPQPRTDATPAQGSPNRAGAGGSAPPRLEPLAPRKPKKRTTTSFHDLANRYRIVNGQPVDPTRTPVSPLDGNGADDDGNGLVDDESPFAPPVVSPVPTPGGGPLGGLFSFIGKLLKPGVKLGPGVRTIQPPRLLLSRTQIERKFKHAKDFGVTDARGKAGYEKLEQAVKSHMDDPATLHISGTYRGQPAVLNYNPGTNRVVVQKPNGEFVSGWSPSQAQSQHILEQGKLGGG
jgi:hypothetical protein